MNLWVGTGGTTLKKIFDICFFKSLNVIWTENRILESYHANPRYNTFQNIHTFSKINLHLPRTSLFNFKYHKNSSKLSDTYSKLILRRLICGFPPTHRHKIKQSFIGYRFVTFYDLIYLGGRCTLWEIISIFSKWRYDNE